MYGVVREVAPLLSIKTGNKPELPSPVKFWAPFALTTVP